MARINREEWRDWREHPVTVEFFRQVATEREEAIKRLAYGQFSEDPGKQSIVIGSINAFTKILEAEFVENT